MPSVDLIVGACVLLVVVWGIWAGAAGTLTLAGFAAGAVGGAALAPLLLDGGHDNDWALVLALPAALLLGGLLAAAVEVSTDRLRSRLGRMRVVDAIGGALLAAGIAACTAWLLGGALAQIASLREPIEDSKIIGRLNTVLDPPGPARARERPILEELQLIRVDVKGGLPPVQPVNTELPRDPDVVRADRSVVKIDVFTDCGGGTGSGWIARDGIVATNAHVAAAATAMIVRIGTRGRGHAARAIWFDPVNDVALLRVPTLKGVRPLPIVRRPKSGTPAAALGFPRGRHAIRAARLGPTTRRLQGFMAGGRLSAEFPRPLNGRLVTIFRGRPEGGSSGGPLVDSRGRVLAMVFGGGGAGLSGGLAVPPRFVLSALSKAGPPVDTGTCPRRGR
jgi:S1-C subfamily serine protease